MTTDSPVWSLFGLDEKHVVAGKKDGSIDILDVELAFVLKSYPLEIKSGVQCIAKHSSDPSIFAISTVMGLCFINISPLNQRVKPIKSVLKGLDIRSITHVVDEFWLISVDDEVNKKKGIVLYHEGTDS
jgi:hypothetical protein